MAMILLFLPTVNGLMKNDTSGVKTDPRKRVSTEFALVMAISMPWQ